jgi:hypothetical protein
MIGDAISVKGANLTVEYSQQAGVDTWSIYGGAMVEIANKSNDDDDSDDSSDDDSSDDDSSDDDSSDDDSSDDDSSDDDSSDDDSSDDDSDEGDACKTDDGDDKDKAEDSDGDGAQEITATFGDKDSPGIVITGDTVESLNVSLGGIFELGKLEVCVPDSDPAQVQYSNQDDTYQLSGELQIKELWSASLQLGTADQPGIEIVKGSFVLDAITIDVENVNTGGLTMKDIKLAYSKDSTGGFDVEVDLDVAFPPEGMEVDGDVKFVDGKLDDISLTFSATGDEEGIEIGDTGVSIVELGATIDNLDQPSDLSVSGTIGLEFGGQLQIEGEEVTMLRSNGSVKIDKNSLTIDDMVFVGAIEDEDDNWSGILGEGDASISLDWAEAVYKLQGDVKVPSDPGVTVTAELLLSKGNIYFTGEAKLEIPKSIPVVGGWVLDEIGAAMQSIKGDPNDSFAAGWTKVIFATVGAKYDFGTKAFSFLGGKAVKEIKQTVKQNEEDAEKTTITKSFTIPDGAESLMVKITLSEEGVSELLIPDLTVILLNEEFIQINGMSVPGEIIYMGLSAVSNADGKTSTLDQSVPIAGGIATEVIVAGANPIELTYQVTPLPEYQQKGIKAGNGIMAFNYITELAPNLNIDVEVTAHYPEPSNSVTGVQTNPSAQLVNRLQRKSVYARQPAGLDLNYWTYGTLKDDAKIHVFIDDDDQGYNGRPIARNLAYGDHDPETGGGQSVLWNGETFKSSEDQPYYFYTVLDDGVNAPTTSAYSDPITRSPILYGNVYDVEQDEKALRHLRVYLDYNQNGRYDHAEEPVTLTNSQGEYAFHSVRQGMVTVGIIHTRAYRVDPNLNDNSRLVTVDVQDTPQRIDFGLNLLASVGGHVYRDSNNDQILDNSDQPLEGMTVFFDKDGDLTLDSNEVTAKTKQDGSYRFYGLPQGSSHELVLDSNEIFGSRLFIVATGIDQGNGYDFAIPTQQASQPPVSSRSSSGSLNSFSGVILLLGGVFIFVGRLLRHTNNCSDPNRIS